MNAPLNSTRLAQIKATAEQYMANPKTTPHGYPVRLVLDLVETCFILKKRKKFYQHRYETLVSRLRSLVCIEKENSNGHEQ